jgi:hypothetical protein
MASALFEQQTWPRRVARGVTLAASGLAAVRQQEGVAAADAQRRSRAARDHLTAVTARQGRFEWGLLGPFAHKHGRTNGEILAQPGSVSCESVAQRLAAG